MPLVRLCVANHPAAAWEESVEPWLCAHGVNWRERRAVLVPNSTWAAALKAQAVAARRPAIGVAWFTPGKWRAEALRARPGPAARVALREDLHLLLELAAAQLPDNPLARAYGVDPAPFQELLDALDGAGWSHEVFSDPAARELAANAVKLRAEAGWMTAAEADRVLREAAAATDLPLMGERLLAVGFGPNEWSLRPLLEAAAAAYAAAEFVLDDVEADEPGAAAWVGTWEELAGPAEWLERPPTEPAPWDGFAAAFAAAEKPRATGRITPTATPNFWLAENVQAEADVVTAQALAFLAGAEGDQPPRVGVVVGSVNSPLAREVAARFTALGLPHHDASGHNPGPAPAQALFEAWLDWQEDGRLGGLVAWLRALHRHGQIAGRAAEDIERALREAAAATLADDPAVLAGWLRATSDENAATRDFLAAWPRASNDSSWDELMAEILRVSAQLGWPDPPEALTERAQAWHLGSAVVPRASVWRWARAVCRVPGRTRAARGREPFAPLHVLDAAGAAASRWTHLILGGLQHGEWPADDEDSPLLDEGRIEELNRAVARQGSQGEGHSIVAPGHGLLLPARARRRRARAAFARLLGLPTAGLALSTRETDPADGRAARLSEFFWTSAAQALGHLPTDGDWNELARSTRAWRNAAATRAAPAVAADENSLAEIASTPRAYAARRDATAKFDEYSFCVAVPPTTPLRLSCRAWAEAVAQPGAAWFRQRLRVEPRWDPARQDEAARSIGLWAHDWVRPGPANSAAGTPSAQPLPTAELWEKIAATRAETVRGRVAAAYATASRTVPTFWTEAWMETARVVWNWIRELAETGAGKYALAEVSLPPGLTGPWTGSATELPLKGRLDLVLLDQAATLAPGGLVGLTAWLLDFKSGSAEALTVKQLAKGNGLQLALYALALRALGADLVELTQLTREAAAEPQLDAGKFTDASLAGLWQLLAAMALSGTWGEFHDLADVNDRRGDYPSATLPVPVEILREKWNLTHPYFTK